MNRATRMLDVLRDGRPHARREIFERAGFMLTNNAASELREMGYDVRQSSGRVDGVTVYSYRLHGSSSESVACLSAEPSLTEGKHDRTDGRQAQDSLFTFPRSPDWS